MTQCLSSSAYPTFSTSSPTSPVLLCRICGTTAGTQLMTALTVSPVPIYPTSFFSRLFASLLHRCFILSLTDDSALPVLVLNLCRDKLSCYSCFFTVIVVLFALRFLSSMAHAVCCSLLIVCGDIAAAMCPVYKAWRDIPIHGVAHRPAECANGGKCDRKTGKCNCFERFEGPACQLCKQ